MADKKAATETKLSQVPADLAQPIEGRTEVTHYGTPAAANIASLQVLHNDGPVGEDKGPQEDPKSGKGFANDRDPLQAERFFYNHPDDLAAEEGFDPELLNRDKKADGALVAGVVLDYPKSKDDSSVVWKGTTKKHHTVNGATVPRGVKVFWDGFSADSAGGGLCYAKDVAREGETDLVRIDEITDRWGLPLLGWSEG